eukprot:gene2977-1626_t
MWEGALLEHLGIDWDEWKDLKGVGTCRHEFLQERTLGLPNTWKNEKSWSRHGVIFHVLSLTL